MADKVTELVASCSARDRGSATVFEGAFKVEDLSLCRDLCSTAVAIETAFGASSTCRPGAIVNIRVTDLRPRDSTQDNAIIAFDKKKTSTMVT